MTKSEELFEEGKKIIPGGVNSPVRAFKSVGGTPHFVRYAKYSKIYDVDGKEYIDYVCSWGPLILGHAHPELITPLIDAIKRGTSYGAPTEFEIEMAKMITQAFPSIEMVRLVNSGTEATMSAIRLARGYTGRDKIVKFEGCYHGHADPLLVQAGSGLTTFGVPTSLGVPNDYAKLTLCAPFNDINYIEELFKKEGENIACVIVEPIPGNMGLVLPKEGFLQGLRKITQEYGSLLIFDEVITGFRVTYGGAQTIYNIKPDLTCLGKIIGGGFPIGAYGGKREIMEKVSPTGGVYQAGTLSGNPVAVVAGIETLKILKRPNTYEKLKEKRVRLCNEIKKISKEFDIPIFLTEIASIFTIFFTKEEVFDYKSALTSNTQMYAKYFHSMLSRGINLPPSQFEVNFISLAHTDEDIDKTLEAVRESFKKCRT